MAWTPDMKGRWAVNWVTWPRFSQFAGQLISWTGKRRGERDGLKNQPFTTTPPTSCKLVPALEPQRPVGQRRFTPERLIMRLVVVPRGEARDGPSRAGSDGDRDDGKPHARRPNRERGTRERASPHPM